MYYHRLFVFCAYQTDTRLRYPLPSTDAFRFSDIQILGGTFSNCYSIGNGAFLFAKDGAAVTVKDGDIVNNRAGARGGAVSRPCVPCSVFECMCPLCNDSSTLLVSFEVIDQTKIEWVRRKQVLVSINACRHFQRRLGCHVSIILGTNLVCTPSVVRRYDRANKRSPTAVVSVAERSHFAFHSPLPVTGAVVSMRCPCITCLYLFMNSNHERLSDVRVVVYKLRLVKEVIAATTLPSLHCLERMNAMNTALI